MCSVPVIVEYLMSYPVTWTQQSLPPLQSVIQCQCCCWMVSLDDNIRYSNQLLVILLAEIFKTQNLTWLLPLSPFVHRQHPQQQEWQRWRHCCCCCLYRQWSWSSTLQDQPVVCCDLHIQWARPRKVETIPWWTSLLHWRSGFERTMSWMPEPKIPWPKLAKQH